MLVSGSLTGISSSELASQSCVAPQISTMTSNGVAAPQMSNNVTVMQRQRHGHRFCDEIDLNNPLCQNPPHSMNYQYQGKGLLLIVKNSANSQALHFAVLLCFGFNSFILLLCLRDLMSEAGFKPRSCRTNTNWLYRYLWPFSHSGNLVHSWSLLAC